MLTWLNSTRLLTFYPSEHEISEAIFVPMAFHTCYFTNMCYIPHYKFHKIDFQLPEIQFLLTVHWQQAFSSYVQLEIQILEGKCFCLSSALQIARSGPPPPAMTLSLLFVPRRSDTSEEARRARSNSLSNVTSLCNHTVGSRSIYRSHELSDCFLVRQV